MVIMMRNTIFVAACGCLTLLTIGCKPKFTEPDTTAGEMNPARFVMIGDGHSGGYMNDALYYDGQVNSLAALIGLQLQLVGGEEFTTRLVAENSVGVNLTGQSRLKLGYKTDCKSVTALSPVRVAEQGDNSILNFTPFGQQGKFRNFGIPGMRVLDVLNVTYAQTNPFFARMASSADVSPLEDVLEINPTFFALYLGVEECMSYAKSGGTVNNLPTVEEFETAYSQLAQQLVTQGAKGVVATIPDLRVMPYFRTIPYDGLNLGADNVTTLNNIFNPLGYFFQEGPNPFTIIDPAANEFQVRQILQGELLLLSIPLDSVKCNQMGSVFPFRNEFVLTFEEQNYLTYMTAAYNEVIRSVANTYNLAVVETNSFYQKLFTGFTYNGVNFTAQFVSGGAFSLDGIHLNAKGNALLANEFIRAINKKFGASIPELNAGAYPGVLFP
jgi:hypothetical protein